MSDEKETPKCAPNWRLQRQYRKLLERGLPFHFETKCECYDHESPLGMVSNVTVKDPATQEWNVMWLMIESPEITGGCAEDIYFHFSPDYPLTPPTIILGSHNIPYGRSRHEVPLSGTPLGDPPQRGLKEGGSVPSGVIHPSVKDSDGLIGMADACPALELVDYIGNVYCILTELKQ